MGTYNRSSASTSLLQGQGAIFGLLRRSPWASLTALVVVIGAAAFGYGMFAWAPVDEQARTEAKAREELTSVVAAVDKLMVLPEGDEPVLATVTDADALQKQQAFFTGVINGDQLLLFPKNLKAIIYSPSRDRIINAGPIEQTPTAQDSTAPQSATSDARAVSVEIRNGSGKSGAASDASALLASDDVYTVIRATDAASVNYARSIVVNHGMEIPPTVVQTLASRFDAEVVSVLPGAEEASAADIVLILGR